MKRSFCTLAMLCLIATTAAAQSAADLKAFEGVWTCKGMAFAGVMGPEHATTATVSGRWILGGKWMDVHYAENKTTANPKPIDVRMFMSYDEPGKKIVNGTIDNMGGYGTSESSGWSNSVMTLAGMSNGGGMQMKSRDTFTMKGSKTIMHTGEYEMEGSWKKADEETCTKK